MSRWIIIATILLLSCEMIIHVSGDDYENNNDVNGPNCGDSLESTVASSCSGTIGTSSVTKEESNESLHPQNQATGEGANTFTCTESTEELRPRTIHVIDSVEVLESLQFMADDSWSTSNICNTVDLSQPTVPPVLWVVLVHQPSCPHSQTIKALFEALHVPSTIGLGIIPVQASTVELLNMLQVQSTPYIAFLKRDQMQTQTTDPNMSHRLWSVVYQGSFTTEYDLHNGLRHYWSRLLYSNIRHRTWLHHRQQQSPTTTYLEALTISVLTLKDLEALLQPKHYSSLFAPSSFASSSSSTSRLPLDPLLSQREQEKIRSIYQQALVAVPPSDHWIICRCKSPSDDENQNQDDDDDDKNDEDDADTDTGDYYYHEDESEKGDDNQVHHDGDTRLKVLNHSTFDAVAAVMSLHHEALFCIFDQCPISTTKSSASFLNETSTSGVAWGNQTELVAIYRKVQNRNLHNDSINNGVVSLALYATLDASSSSLQAEEHDIAEYLARLFRPKILWWDRQTTTPIAFAPYYTMHAVLFLDVDDMSNNINNNKVLAEFGQMCHDHHFSTLNSNYNYSNSNIKMNKDSDVVCLMVPSTETRVLTTFGIDIWSGWDTDLKFETKHSMPAPTTKATTTTSSSSLPILMVTIRTEEGGVERYYLDHPQGRINDFVQNLVSRNQPLLQPSMKTMRILPERHSRVNFASQFSSSKRHSHSPLESMNRHGVWEWTTYHASFHAHTNKEPSLSMSSGRAEAESTSTFARLQELSYTPRPHTLLMIYAPTCGHCKRLSITWNRLGRLIHSLQWDSWLTIARLDVTKEEFTAVGASLLPSIYYYYYNDDTSNKEDNDQSTGTTPASTPIKSGPIWFSQQEAGTVSDPLELVEWLLDVGVNLNETELLSSLLVSLNDSLNDDQHELVSDQEPDDQDEKEVDVSSDEEWQNERETMPNGDSQSEEIPTESTGTKAMDRENCESGKHEADNDHVIVDNGDGSESDVISLDPR